MHETESRIDKVLKLLQVDAVQKLRGSLLTGFYSSSDMNGWLEILPSGLKHGIHYHDRSMLK